MPDANLALANVEIVRRYLASLERDDPDAAPGEFFAPDVVQVEWPNRLVPDGARRDLDAVREGRTRRRSVIRNQRFEIENVVAVGDEVALEVLWSGELLLPFGLLKAGDRMHGHFAVFIELRDGKIIRQRNYDCFDPF
jgi:ketosteroid isomerase-like protein